MIRPRTNRIMSAGTSVTDNSAAAAMANVLVRWKSGSELRAGKVNHQAHQ
jgi:hypothetical protein